MGFGAIQQVTVLEGYKGTRSPKKVILLDFDCVSLFRQAVRGYLVLGFETAAAERFTHVCVGSQLFKQ